jgi:hypothetical protein
MFRLVAGPRVLRAMVRLGGVFERLLNVFSFQVRITGQAKSRS